MAYPIRHDPLFDQPAGYPPAPCPDCDCCTKRLCERAAAGGVRCSHGGNLILAGEPANCPCTTPSTADARALAADWTGKQAL